MLGRMKPYLLAALFLLSCLKVVSCTKGEDIAKEAKYFIGCKMWSFAGSYGTGKNTDKSHLFVHDVLDCVDANPVTRWNGNDWVPIDGEEWGKANSPYLKQSRFWKKCIFPVQVGDVVSDGSHVAIVNRNKFVTQAYRNKVQEIHTGVLGQIPCWRHC